MADGKTIRIAVQERQDTGSRSARRLRSEGFVPGVLYGDGEPHPFYVAERELRKALTGSHGMHAILDVVLDGKGKAHHAVLKDYQLDPRRSTLLHVDLHEVRLDRPIQAQVVVELVGEPEGVKMGGVLQLVAREINVEALPMEMPDRLELDVSALQIGDNARVADLASPDGVTILDDSETVVAAVLAPRLVVEEELEEGAEEAEGEPGEAEAEGGEAPSESAGESDSE
jgi:large subunit ribosomal protein L25